MSTTSPITSPAFTCADFHLDRVLVAATSPETTTRTREWAVAVGGPDAEIRVVRSDDAGIIGEAIAEFDPDLVVVGVPTGLHVSRRSAAHWIRGMVRRVDRPMAIIGPQVESPFSRQETVVVGVGCGPATDAAVPWAACFAARHDLDLALVGIVPPRPTLGRDGLLDVLAFYVDRGLLTSWKRDDLDRWAERIRAAVPSDVEISPQAVEGAVGPRLVEAAVDAAVVVLGRHGFRRDHHALQRPLRFVLDHANWPVVVVPPTAADPSDRET